MVYWPLNDLENNVYKNRKSNDPKIYMYNGVHCTYNSYGIA